MHSLDGRKRKSSAKNLPAKTYCSFVNTFMPKANTRGFPACNRPRRSFPEFNHLHAAAGLALRMPIQIARNYWSQQPGFDNRFYQEIQMFDGKNNRVLDSFSFRLALTAAVFALWSSAGYVLLLLA